MYKDIFKFPQKYSPPVQNGAPKIVIQKGEDKKDFKFEQPKSSKSNSFLLTSDIYNLYFDQNTRSEHKAFLQLLLDNCSNLEPELAKQYYLNRTYTPFFTTEQSIIKESYTKISSDFKIERLEVISPYYPKNNILFPFGKVVIPSYTSQEKLKFDLFVLNNKNLNLQDFISSCKSIENSDFNWAEELKQIFSDRFSQEKSDLFLDLLKEQKLNIEFNTLKLDMDNLGKIFSFFIEKDQLEAKEKSKFKNTFLFNLTKSLDSDFNDINSFIDDIELLIKTIMTIFESLNINISMYDVIELIMMINDKIAHHEKLQNEEVNILKFTVYGEQQNSQININFTNDIPTNGTFYLLKI